MCCKRLAIKVNPGFSIDVFLVRLVDGIIVGDAHSVVSINQAVMFYITVKHVGSNIGFHLSAASETP